MYCVCKEHLDRALDMFVEEYEQSPDLYLFKEISFTAWTVPAKCEFCDKEPEFLVI